MDFRSTFTIQDYDILWPQWFREKWGVHCWFKESGNGAFAPRYEAKTYKTWESLPVDIQRAIDWKSLAETRIVLVYLHECGGITRCQIEKHAIKWSEPEDWRVTEGVTHDYCYRCSDI